MNNFLRITRVVTVAIALGVIVTSARAQYALTNGVASADINPTSYMGMNSWKIGGVEQLYQQWFWYRVGMNAEQSIDTLGTPSVSLTSTNQMTSTYTGAGFTLSVNYLLSGSVGIGSSTINEVITIKNDSGAPLDFHFYQYSDYALGGVEMDTVTMAPTFNDVVVTSGPSRLGETMATPAATRGEVAPWDQTLLKLNDGVPSDLVYVPGAMGPGDITFAFQWDQLIATDGTLIISKIKTLDVELVPEPGTAALALVGLAVLVSRRIIRK
jgi:hypothetical protein